MMEPTTSSRILLVSSEQVHLAGLLAELGSSPPAWIDGQVCGLDGVLAAARALLPDVILTGADLMTAPTIARIQDLHCCCPAGKIVLIGELPEPVEPAALARAGVAAYLHWQDVHPATIGRLLDLIQRMHVLVAGRTVLAGPAARRPSRPPQGGPRLSGPELAVLEALAAGVTCEEIARSEHLGLRTVQRLIRCLEQKLEAPNVHVLIKKAVQQGHIC